MPYVAYHLYGQNKKVVSSMNLTYYLFCNAKSLGGYKKEGAEQCVPPLEVAIKISVPS